MNTIGEFRSNKSAVNQMYKRPNNGVLLLKDRFSILYLNDEVMRQRCLDIFAHKDLNSR